MKKTILITTFLICTMAVYSQIDPLLLRVKMDTTKEKMNMDAVYNRPFLQMGKLPIAVGGYAEANYQYLQRDGISERHQFQMRRLTLFLSSQVSKRIHFLTELEFEDGTKEINIEFASLDVELHPMLNFRGGIVMNPIGAFNQNHDGPKWEFVDRPIAATQMLPATWSNAGFGIFGKKYSKDWVLGYEIYFTNGFDESIVSNTENKTFLPAAKLNKNRFEESTNGMPIMTAKIAVRNKKIGELGISMMKGVYNKFEDDGLYLDERRSVSVLALDFNKTFEKLKTSINGEWAWIGVNIPDTYSEQYGTRQQGGFVDIVQPVFKRPVLGFTHSVINAACRFEYVDWNIGRFRSTGGRIADELYSIVPAISWRPSPQTVFRVNYRYNWQRDLVGNPPSKLAGFQVGFSTYF